MRKATKKLAVTMAAALMVSTVSLTGCGGADSNGGGSSAGGSSAGSASSSSVASSGSSEQKAEDPVQNLIKATTETVKLNVWVSEQDQEFAQGLIDSFKAKYPDVTFDITLGAKSEADAKDGVLADVEAAPDVYSFADDQILELVNGGALQEIANTYTYDVKGENLPGSVEAATINGKLYAYPRTADNGYFMYYDKSIFSESDVESLDQMIAVAKEKKKKIGMMVSNAWYLYSFFKGAGLNVDLNEDGAYPFLIQEKYRAGYFTHYAGEGTIRSAKLSYNGEEVDLCLCRTHASFSQEGKTRILTLDPVEIEFYDLTVKLQTKMYFEEGSSAIRIERNILEMSNPDAEVTLNEYIVACYGTTEYPEDMTGIALSVSKDGEKKDISYEYKCREEVLAGAKCASAVIPAIETKVSLTTDAEDGEGYIREGYAFSPMFTLGYQKKIQNKEVITTWLNLEKAN